MAVLSAIHLGTSNGEHMPGKNSQATGYLFAIVQAVFYSTMGIFGKLLYSTGLGAQEVVILRFLCTTVLLGAFMLVWRKEPLISRQPAVYLQAVFYFASAMTYFFAVERMNAGILLVVASIALVTAEPLLRRKQDEPEGGN